MASYDIGTGLSGAGTGAAVGAKLGGGWGAVGGAVVGAGLGFLGKKKKAVAFDRSRIDALKRQRDIDIGSFSAQLAGARHRLEAQRQQLVNRTMSTFSPDLEASYGARNLSVTGGAFQSALAKKAADLQAQLGVSNAESERADYDAVEKYKADLFNTMMGYEQGKERNQVDLDKIPYAETGDLNNSIGRFAMTAIPAFFEKSKSGNDMYTSLSKLLASKRSVLSGGTPTSYSYNQPPRLYRSPLSLP